MTNFKKGFIALVFSIGLVLIFLPVQAQTVLDKLKSNSQTTEFAKALESTNIDERINKSGPFTLFAPSNSAFNRLSMLEKENNDLLLNHIFMGMATERSLKAMSEVTCLSGKNLSIQNGSGQDISINDIQIVTTNLKADNGVIHIIDGVIK